MALHNYIYLKHKSHDPHCHTLIAREHDPRPKLGKPGQAALVEIDHNAKTGATGQAKTCCGDCSGKCTDKASW
ncbi:LAFE_0A01332g1_1 [Lachancea fermentati]|uniref:LAFE_0A01332g1_1 n=1 Tax=Lachancea fermentati TaxID=4955 RepID=A0A1G4M693_LACFM|nr:LAFE_0A01332g1_1 [Lachancea fermentati]